MDPVLNTIHQGDCVAGMRRLSAGIVDLAFADPPFNIGYEYDVYDDKKGYRAYLDWSRQWMSEVCRVLKSNGTFWLAIGDEYAAEMKLMAQDDLKLTCRSWVIWYYTFGVHCTKKFTRSHAHLFYFVKNPNSFTFNEDEIAVPSARQLVYADGRAFAGGRMPDDTWILRPQDVPNGFAADHATWYFPRVAGTFKERAGFHGCQMPEQLLGRIIRTSSQPGQIVLDPFAGSGTTLTVAKKLGREFVGWELSSDYASKASARLSRAWIGEPLEGAPEPIVSAPRTPGSSSKVWLRTGVNRAVLEAFLRANDGWSSDRVIADPELNATYSAECEDLELPGGPADWNRALMRLRKAGQLRGLPKAKRTTFSEQEMDQYLFASEIAMKVLTKDEVSLDEVLCDPQAAGSFDRIARSFAPGFSSLQYRWAALTLRKRASRWRTLAQTLTSTPEVRRAQKFKSFAEVPIEKFIGMAGVYWASEEKPVYVGETFDLGTRFEQHLKHLRAREWRKHAKDPHIDIIELIGIDALERRKLQCRLIARYTPELNLHRLGISCAKKSA